jgi:hypothetical protein
MPLISNVIIKYHKFTQSRYFSWKMLNRLYRSTLQRSPAFGKGFHASAIASFKKTIEQLSKEKPALLKDATVLVRVDFNVPMSKTEAGVITDDTRIKEALPTINFLSKAGSKVVLVSHSGRPKGQVNEKMRMASAAKRLGELIGKPVTAVSDTVGPEVEAAVARYRINFYHTRFARYKTACSAL